MNAIPLSIHKLNVSFRFLLLANAAYLKKIQNIETSFTLNDSTKILLIKRLPDGVDMVNVAKSGCQIQTPSVNNGDIFYLLEVNEVREKISATHMSCADFNVRRAWRVYLTVQVRYGGYQLPTISLRQGCPS